MCGVEARRVRTPVQTSTDADPEMDTDTALELEMVHVGEEVEEWTSAANPMMRMYQSEGRPYPSTLGARNRNERGTGS